MKKITIIVVLAGLCTTRLVKGQDIQEVIPTFSAETRVTNFLQGGYEVGIFYNGTRNFSFGLQVAGQDVEGSAQDLLFDISEDSNLTIDLPWLVAFKTRYHIRNHLEGWYFEASVGAEQFRVRSGDETQRNNNGFILTGVGYIWHPWNRDGFYVNPNIGVIYAFAREDEQLINGASYELNPFFPSPALSLGWKF